MNPAINLFYVHGDFIGYSRMGTGVAKALQDMGITVFDAMPMPAQFKKSHERNLNAVEGLAHVVCWASVPSHMHGFWPGQYRAVLTMWEAQRLPESFRECLPEFDVVMVPSHHNVELFSRYHDNVAFVPLGVDPVQWHYTPRTPSSEFRFLIGGSGSRKGTDLAWRAFNTLWGKEGSWGSGPTPMLTMKSPRGGEFAAPRVEVVSGRISSQAEVDLYAGAHCYLQPSRGEGFGLQPLQALAQGLPTILTAAHGHDSFAHLGLGISATPAKSAYFIYGDAGDWWEPDFDELCDHMRWVYENYEQALDQGKSAAAVIANEFTWANTAARFVAAVGADRLATPYSGDGAWHEPERLRYEVMVNRPWYCEIAGRAFRFTPGERYMEMADVKRVLWEAGILDERCVRGDDTGLAPSQEIEARSASHAYCGACHQRLGSQPTRADDLEVSYGDTGQ
jgi:glycosyltransferase involved in cell wall biosynthesis